MFETVSAISGSGWLMPLARETLDGATVLMSERCLATLTSASAMEQLSAYLLAGTGAVASMLVRAP